MNFSITNLFLLLLPAFGFSQNFYQTTLYDSLEMDSDYQGIVIELEGLYENVNELLSHVEFSVHEQVIFKEVLFYLEKGRTDLLRTELTKPEVRALLQAYELTEEPLLALAKKIEPILARHDKLKWIYISKKNVAELQIQLPDNLNDTRELRKYKLPDNAKILEIGAGSSAFSRLMGNKVKDCQFYLNELDTLALKQMFYELNYHPEIQNLKEKRDHQFFVIRGGEKTTGIENIKMDRIVIRKTIHHFSEPEAMFTSIKKSMSEATELIIKERFPEDCGARCCDNLWSRDKFEAVMAQNGFTNIFMKKMTKENGDKFWVYKYRLVI